MKVYNQDKTQILTEYDLTKGYLQQDTITINQPEVPSVTEQFHYETLKEYANGGKDVKKVVDVAGVEYKPAKTYTETIMVYIPYTTAELAKQQVEEAIAELKQKLTDTDYQALKYAEGHTSAEDYAPIRAQRQAWRDEINALEENIAE